MTLSTSHAQRIARSRFQLQLDRIPISDTNRAADSNRATRLWLLSRKFWAVWRYERCRLLFGLPKGNLSVLLFSSLRLQFSTCQARKVDYGGQIDQPFLVGGARAPRSKARPSLINDEASEFQPNQCSTPTFCCA